LNQKYSTIINLGPPLNRNLSIIFHLIYKNDHLREILKLLNKNKIEATFFLTGTYLKKNKEIPKLIRDYGHEIGGYTYSHKDLTKLRQDQVELEIEKFIAVASNKDLINRTLFSLPYNQYNRSILEITARYNYPQIIYPTIDLSKIQTDNKLTDSWVNIFKGGNLINLRADKEKTINLLTTLIKEAEKQDFSWQKVSQLLQIKHPYKTITILAGKTIFELGKEVGISPAVIAQLNRVPLNKKLLAYQLVYLPASENQFFSYTVLPGDTIKSISSKFNLDQRQLEDLNGPLAMQHLRPGQQVIIPQEAGLSYTVQTGDTFLSISQQLSISLPDLILRNPQLITAGQKLIIYPTKQN